MTLVDIAGFVRAEPESGVTTDSGVLVEPTREPAHRVQTTLEQDIATLAVSLLDLRTEYEASLRTLTSMHRMLEFMRRGEATASVADLLFGEMVRNISDLAEQTSSIREVLRTAALQLDAIRVRVPDISPRQRP